MSNIVEPCGCTYERCPNALIQWSWCIAHALIEESPIERGPMTLAYNTHECGCWTSRGTEKRYLIFCALAAQHWDNGDMEWLLNQHGLSEDI